VSATPTIQFALSGPALQVLARCTDTRALGAAIAQEVDRQNELTVSHIQRKYLSFPFTKKTGGRVSKQPTTLEGLRIISGRLRGSIRRTTATVQNDSVTAAIGSNVKYAGIHEFGGRIQMPARARRIHFIEGKFASEKSFKRHLKKFTGAKRLIAYGRPYTINMPERSYLRRGIADRQEATGKGVSRAIVRYAQGGAN
jgi:phage gpG-like protein